MSKEQTSRRVSPENLPAKIEALESLLREWREALEEAGTWYGDENLKRLDYETRDFLGDPE